MSSIFQRYATAKYIFDIHGFGFILKERKQFISLSSPLLDSCTRKQVKSDFLPPPLPSSPLLSPPLKLAGTIYNLPRN